MKEKIKTAISFLKEKITNNRRIKSILLFLSANKRAKYMLIVSVLVLFAVVFRMTYALFREDLDYNYSQLNIGNLRYEMIINDPEDAPVNNPENRNIITGDRILKLDGGQTEYFLISLSSNNSFKTKYEIIYQVCNNADCTSTTQPTPPGDKIALYKGMNYEGYPDPVSDVINANDVKQIVIVTQNGNSETKYIKIGLNAGYYENNLPLHNLISNTYNLEEGVSLLDFTAIGGAIVGNFPSDKNYTVNVVCRDKDGTTSNITSEMIYDDGWSLSLNGITERSGDCNIEFIENFGVLKVEPYIWGQDATSRPSTPVNDFPTSRNYNTTVTCLDKNDQPSSMQKVIGWASNNKWRFEATEIPDNGNKCIVDFKPTQVVLNLNGGTSTQSFYQSGQPTYTLINPTPPSGLQFSSWQLTKGAATNASLSGSTLTIGSVAPTYTNPIIVKAQYTMPNSNPNKVTNFDYTGGEQVFTAPYGGTYKLEVWGAQGGNALQNGSINQTNLGYGGYATGVVSLNKGDKLYINVGGKGTNGTNGKDAPGGYNGGGKGTWDNADNEASGGGGGATHIALDSGLLTTFSSKVGRLLIVAGGGGGSSYSYSAGAGGGATGGKSSYTSSTGGGQSASAGHVFGQGQDASGTADSDGVGGGGGGYYGGSMYNVSAASSGTGGSGYIGNSLLLSSKEMYCYNCGNNSNASTKTTNTTQVSEAATTNKAKIGNGYARLTILTVNY